MDKLLVKWPLPKLFIFWWCSSLVVGILWFTFFFHNPLFMAPPPSSLIFLAGTNCILLPFVIGTTSRLTSKDVLMLVLMFISIITVLVSFVVTPLQDFFIFLHQDTLVSIMDYLYSNPVSALRTAFGFEHDIDVIQALGGEPPETVWLCDSLRGFAALFSLSCLLCASSMWAGVRVRILRGHPGTRA